MSKTPVSDYFRPKLAALCDYILSLAKKDKDINLEEYNSIKKEYDKTKRQIYNVKDTA